MHGSLTKIRSDPKKIYLCNAIYIGYLYYFKHSECDNADLQKLKDVDFIVAADGEYERWTSHFIV